MDELFSTQPPWSLGVNPGSLFFYWTAPALAWLIVRLVSNYREYNELVVRRKRHPGEHGEDKAKLDAEQARLLREARLRAARYVAGALLFAVLGTAVSSAIAYAVLS